MSKILSVKNLKIDFHGEKGTLRAVDNNSFDLIKGRTTGLVGESGCGKSVTAFSLIRLIPNPPGEISGGQIIYQDRDILSLHIDEMRKIRGKEIAMIFQEPMTALNPVYSIEKQMVEVFQLHFPELSKAEMKERCVKLLDMVGIPSAAQRIKDYPHQLSGGMRQRIVIAMALSCSPKILVADEPTTALDVTIQAQILELMNDLKRESEMSILFITHDLGVVAEMCDDVIVMYAGKIVETGSVYEIFESPQHPYTRGLLDSIPKRGLSKETKLPTIDGMVPDLFHPPVGCRFADRCNYKTDQCERTSPGLEKLGDSGRQVACFHPLGGAQ